MSVDRYPANRHRRANQAARALERGHGPLRLPSLDALVGGHGSDNSLDLGQRGVGGGRSLLASEGIVKNITIRS